MPTIIVLDAASFERRAGPFLVAHEAEHNLPLGLLGRLRDEPRLYGSDPTFVVAEDEGAVVGCYLRTPPHGAVLSRFDSLDAVDDIAEAVLRIHEDLPGAVGPADVVARFATTWSSLTGAEARVGIRQGVHVATTVGDLPRAPGMLRPADPTDIPVVLRWLEAFAEEALGDVPHREDAEGTYRRREEDPEGVWLIWDDDGPVSLAGYGNPTPHGARVGPVYTPPDCRGRGYATSLVADLTRERLSSGLAYCFLFTDLANPTSNAIYARIGYEQVGAWDQWVFESVQK